MPTADMFELSDSLVTGDRKQRTNVLDEVEIELRPFFFLSVFFGRNARDVLLAPEEWEARTAEVG